MSAEGTPAEVIEGRAQWAVVTGDAFELMAELPDKSIDIVHADPPYSEHVHSKSRAGARKKPLLSGDGKLYRCGIDREKTFGFDPVTELIRKRLAVACERLVKRWVLTFCDVESSHLWRIAYERAGLQYVRTGAWIKGGATPQFSGDRPGVGFEAIVLMHPKGRKRWNGGGSLGIWSHWTCTDRGGTGKKMSNDRRAHPTQKPLSLALELTALFSEPGEIVLDPMCGSGTHGVAALRHGRRFIGYERDAAFAEIARERLRAEMDSSSADARKLRQLPLFGEGAA